MINRPPATLKNDAWQKYHDTRKHYLEGKASTKQVDSETSDKIN